MLLFCPNCGHQHIDEASEGWDNPPHKSHLCHACGCIWRPADVATNGVEKIATAGKADTWALPLEPVALARSTPTARTEGLELGDLEFAQTYLPMPGRGWSLSPEEQRRLDRILAALSSPQEGDK